MKTNYRFEHGHQVGLDWAKHSSDEVIENPTPPKPKRAPNKRTRPEAGPRLKPRVSRKAYDYDAIVRQYEVGLRTGEIAKQIGCDPSTVRHILISRGVFKPDRDKGGKRQSDKCSKDLHEMTGDNLIILPNGKGRECRKCRQTRQKEAARKRRKKAS